jgi:thiol:disulfide interchange protein
MRSAGARALRVDDDDIAIPSADRDAVLSAWEQKSLIDESPLRTRRFQRANATAAHPAQAAPARAAAPAPAPERRTVTITGRPGQEPQRPRRRSAAQQQLVAQPDRVALWAFLLGLFLVFVAAATATAAPV